MLKTLLSRFLTWKNGPLRLFATHAKSAKLKKRSFFPAIWLALEKMLRNWLERWAPFGLRFESSNIMNLQVQRFLRESKTAFKWNFHSNYFHARTRKQEKY